MSIERTIEAVGAKKILDCLRADQGNELLKHNYYSNKFDSTGKLREFILCFSILVRDLWYRSGCTRVHLVLSFCKHYVAFCFALLMLPAVMGIFLFVYTAWNDFDAIPRSASTLGLTDHGGSRKRLLFSRREMQRNEVSEIMTHSKSRSIFPEVSHRRVNMITDPAVENS